MTQNDALAALGEILDGPPPTTWVLVHGACRTPEIFRDWRGPLEERGAAQVFAPDLQAGADPATLTTAGQAQRVRAALEMAEHPVILLGWSMGGLVAATLADHDAVAGLILLEPSVPAPLVDRAHARITPRPGLLDPEATYGAGPDDYPRRPESGPARDERKNGVEVLLHLPDTPVLVVAGRDYPERGRPVAGLYDAAGTAVAYLELPDTGHVDLVVDPAARAVILARWHRE